MDPSRYARAFGVQSESNKNTVTRVASNEIVYRRVVDTYRRDMSSTMTNIHREQKKLRRNIRTYRRRLREAHNLPVKKRKPFKVGWIAYEPESSFFDLPLRKSQKHTNTNTNTENFPNSDETQKTDNDPKQLPRSKLQAQVDVFLKSVDEHVHNMHTRKREEIRGEEDDEIGYDKNGRRRFLFGSAGVGVSSDALKGFDFDLEGYRVDERFSDVSSDDEDGSVTGRKTSRNQSRKKRVMELLRLNSAYFTPIDLKDSEQDPQTTEEHGKTDIDGNNKIGENKTVVSEVSEVATNPTSEPEEKKGPPSFSKTISIVVQKIKDENENEIVHGQSQNQTQKFELSGKRSSKVNFGDLIKFKHHGVNTKKLFSMVDQLASKYGVLSKENEREKGNRRTHASINQRATPNLEPIHESNAKSSIFYAMKYGYGKKGGGLSPNEEHRHDGQDENPNREHLQTYDKRILRDHKGSSSSRSQSTPYQEDTVDGSSANYISDHVDRKYELPFLQVSSPASLTRHSVEGANLSRSGNEAAPLTTPSVARSYDSVTKRRSSILDASNYVSNLRRRTNIQEHDRMFGIKNDADRFGPRRIPAALRKESGMSEHQRKADDNKIAWSSALGQMKLVHTLQDLTHFI